jgi:hypothetical protein
MSFPKDAQKMLRGLLATVGGGKWDEDDELPTLRRNNDQENNHPVHKDAIERLTDFARSDFLGALKVAGQNRDVFRARLLGVLEAKKKVTRIIKRRKAEWRF